VCEVTRDVITVLRAELEVSFSYFRLTNSLRVGVGSTPRGDTAGLTKLNLVCLLGWMTGESSSRTAVVLHSVYTGSGGPTQPHSFPVDKAVGAFSSPHTFIWC
jgi:hypothetical protein